MSIMNDARQDAVTVQDPPASPWEPKEFEDPIDPKIPGPQPIPSGL
jgi:hypothetical protein